MSTPKGGFMWGTAPQPPYFRLVKYYYNSPRLWRWFSFFLFANARLTCVLACPMILMTALLAITVTLACLYCPSPWVCRCFVVLTGTQEGQSSFLGCKNDGCPSWFAVKNTKQIGTLKKNRHTCFSFSSNLFQLKCPAIGGRFSLNAHASEFCA